MKIFRSRKVVIALDGILGRLWGKRIVRFGAVASFCTAIQELILVVLIHYGVHGTLANAVGFAISAQINFALSTAITWKDRELERSAKGALIGLLSFNAAASLALAANTVVFTAAVAIGFRVIPASLVGVLVGACISFSINHFVTYRKRGKETAMTAPTIEEEQRPRVRVIRKHVRDEGIAFFLPAYNEAANLRSFVPKIVEYFQRYRCEFTVIIVDDGSTKDDTYQVAEELAAAYPHNVWAVHHEQNQGYGAALQTGIDQALLTGHGLVAFSDADHQFDIESFGTLLAALLNEDADLAVGYRIARADSLKRRLMGRGWHWLSSKVLGFQTARDVDCGFKLFRRTMLEKVAPQLRGGYAAVSPEILARAVKAGFTLVEAGLAHKPRAHGEQTGANLKVVFRSLVQLFQIRLVLQKES